VLRFEGLKYIKHEKQIHLFSLNEQYPYLYFHKEGVNKKVPAHLCRVQLCFHRVLN